MKGAYSEPQPIVVYTSTTHHTHTQEANLRRVMHILDNKEQKYEIVFVDLEENASRKAEMLQASGTIALPQVHVNKKFLGTYEEIQDLEDLGQFDSLLQAEGLEVPQADIPDTPRAADRNTKTDGALTVHATKDFVLCKWDPTQTTVPEGARVSWLLQVDNEPVYMGAQCSYSVPKPQRKESTYKLSAYDEATRKFYECSTGQQVLATVAIEPPPPPVEAIFIPTQVMSMPITSRQDLLSCRGVLVTARTGRPLGLETSRPGQGHSYAAQTLSAAQAPKGKGGLLVPTAGVVRTSRRRRNMSRHGTSDLGDQQSLIVSVDEVLESSNDP
jgi:glutaredoxin